MKLLRGTKRCTAFNQGSIATIGNFDGVHLGHQNLIKMLRKKANEKKLPLVLVLFEPQPKEYFQKDQAPARLSTLREKLHSLNDCTVDYVYCIKFNNTLAQMPAIHFINHYLFTILNVTHLFVGEDFRFGKNREGDVPLLQKISDERGCIVDIYPEFSIHNERVSSTRIRIALQQGALTQAAQLLGRPYGMCGRVIKGDGRGRKWGIPTANIGLHRLAIPIHGVFVVKLILKNKTVYGVANIGSRPTVDGTKNVLEVHLLNFNESIYGEMVQVFFLHKLRDEVKFTSIEALITQIHNDIAETVTYLSLNTANI